MSGGSARDYVESDALADEILGILSAEDGATDQQTKPEAAGADDAAAARETPSPAADAAADDAGAADQQPPTGEDEQKVEPEADAPPAIEPPASWSAESKALFAKLPPEFQDLANEVVRRESEREQHVSKASREAAEARKAADDAKSAAEAQQAAAAEERQRYAARLAPQVQKLVQEFTDEFKDITSPADLVKLAAEDPARHNLFVARRDQVAAAVQEQKQIEEQSVTEQNARIAAYMADERKALIEKWPEMGDEKTAAPWRERIVSHLREYGIQDKDMPAVLSNHRVPLLVRDAVLGREAQAKLKELEAKNREIAAKKVAAKPRHVAPGGGDKPNGSAQHAAFLQRATSARNDDELTEALLGAFNSKA